MQHLKQKLFLVCHSSLKGIHTRGNAIEVVFFGQLKARVDVAAKIGIGLSCSSITEKPFLNNLAKYI